MKRHIFLFALILILSVAVLCSCGDKDGGDATGDGTSGSEAVGTGGDTGGDDVVTEPPQKNPEDGEIDYVCRINGTDIEIHFKDSYESDKGPLLSEIKFYLDEERCMLNTEYGTGGKVYYNNVCTLRILEAKPTGADAPAMKLKYNDYEYEIPYTGYYENEVVSSCGIAVRGSGKLLRGTETLERTAAIIDKMLADSPEIAEAMVKSGAFVAVFGKGESVYSIPENRSFYDASLISSEGFGGAVTGISEASIWHWDEANSERPDTDFTTYYPNEFVFALKFGQCIKSAGIDSIADGALSGELKMVYRHAKAAGLWAKSSAIASADDFFGTMTAIWFNVMGESSADDEWDGLRGPVNTRAELYNYDLITYRFMEKIFPADNLDGEWTPVTDTITVTSIAKDEPTAAPASYKFLYPAGSSSEVTLNFGSSYKFCISEDVGFVMDTGSCYNSDLRVGLWWDYSAEDYDLSPMSIIIEEIPGKEVERRTNEKTGAVETVFTVYLKGLRDGYLYELDDAVYSAINSEEEITPSEFTIIFSSDSEYADLLCGGRYLTMDPDEVPATEVPLILADESNINWQILGLDEKASSALFIHGGTANGNAEGVSAASGEEIVISAPETSDGKTFVGWRASAGTVSDATSRVTTVIMPDTDVVIWADYE